MFAPVTMGFPWGESSVGAPSLNKNPPSVEYIESKSQLLSNYRCINAEQRRALLVLLFEAATVNPLT